MGKPTISARQRAWLAEALPLWRERGILSEEQTGRILELYESPAAFAARQRARGVFTLMGVAALLTGLALLLLVGYNWEAMPRPLKLAVIFGAVAIAHAAGLLLRRHGRSGRLAEIPFFLGCLCYGAGIWLVAQIFHLSAHYPDGLWWWAVGVLPFALCLDTLLLHALLVPLLALWAGTEVLAFGHLGAWFLGRWAPLPNGAYSLPLLAAPGVWWAYRRGVPAALWLYAPLLGWWLALQWFAWYPEGNPAYFIGGVGGLLLLLAEGHREGSRFAAPYRVTGMLLVCGVLMPLGYYALHEELRRAGAPGRPELLPLALLAAALLLLLPLSRRAPSARRRLWLPVGLIGFMAALPWMETLGRPRLGMVLVTVLANLAAVSCALWLIRLGLREERGLSFGAGVCYFLGWAGQRYQDLFGDFGGMLGASLMFFLCGAALSLVAIYWRRREARHG